VTLTGALRRQAKDRPVISKSLPVECRACGGLPQTTSPQAAGGFAPSAGRRFPGYKLGFGVLHGMVVFGEWVPREAAPNPPRVRAALLESDLIPRGCYQCGN
jgi:hypothetical protein